MIPFIIFVHWILFSRISKAYLNLKQHNSKLLDLVESLQLKNSALQQIILQIGSDGRKRGRLRHKSDKRFMRRRSDQENGPLNGTFSEDSDSEMAESQLCSKSKNYCNKEKEIILLNKELSQNEMSHCKQPSESSLELGKKSEEELLVIGEVTSKVVEKTTPNVKKETLLNNEKLSSGTLNSESLVIPREIENNIHDKTCSTVDGSSNNTLEDSKKSVEKVNFFIEDASDVSDDDEENYFANNLSSDEVRTNGDRNETYSDEKRFSTFTNGRRNKRRRGGKKFRRFQRTGWTRTTNGNVFVYPDPKDDLRSRSRDKRQTKRESSGSEDRGSRKRRSSRSSSYDSRKNSNTKRSRSRSSSRTKASKSDDKKIEDLNSEQKRNGTFIPINANVGCVGPNSILANDSSGKIRSSIPLQLYE